MEHYSVDGRTFSIVSGGGQRRSGNASQLSAMHQSGANRVKVAAAVGDVQRRDDIVALETGGQVQSVTPTPPPRNGHHNNGKAGGGGVARGNGVAKSNGVKGKPPLPPQKAAASVATPSSSTVRCVTLPAPCRAKIIDARKHFFTDEQQRSPSPTPPTSPLDSETIDGFRQRALQGRERAARSRSELAELERQLQREEEEEQQQQRLRRHLAVKPSTIDRSVEINSDSDSTGDSSSGSGLDDDDDDDEEEKVDIKNTNHATTTTTTTTFVDAADVVFLSSDSESDAERRPKLCRQEPSPRTTIFATQRDDVDNRAVPVAPPRRRGLYHFPDPDDNDEALAGFGIKPPGLAPSVPVLTSTPRKLYTNRASLLEAAALATGASGGGGDDVVIPPRRLIGNDNDSESDVNNGNNRHISATPSDEEEPSPSDSSSSSGGGESSDDVVAGKRSARQDFFADDVTIKNDINRNRSADAKVIVPFPRSDALCKTVSGPASVGVSSSRKSSLTGSSFSVNDSYLETDVDTFQSREIIRASDSQSELQEEQQRHYYRLNQQRSDRSDDEELDDDGKAKERSPPGGGIYSFGAFGGAGSVRRYRPHKLKTQSLTNLIDNAGMAATTQAAIRHDNGHTSAAEDSYDDEPLKTAPSLGVAAASDPISTTHPYDDRAKSMEFLLRDENKMAAWPPENQLRATATAAARVPSEHELRIRRSLQKLNLPDWYKNSPLANQMGSTDGFILRRDDGGGRRPTTPRWEDVRSSRSQSSGNIQSGDYRSSCTTPTTPGSAGRQSRNVVIAQRVMTPDWRHVKQSRESLLPSPATSPSPFFQYYKLGGVAGGRQSAPSPRSVSPTTSDRYHSLQYPRQAYLGWRSSERLGRETGPADGTYFYRTPAERMSHGPGYYTLRYGIHGRTSGTVTPTGNDEVRPGSALSGAEVEANGGHSEVQEYSTSGRMQVAELVREIDKLISGNNRNQVALENGAAPEEVAPAPPRSPPRRRRLQQSQLEALSRMSPKSAARQRVVWLESSFVGERPAEVSTSPTPPLRPARRSASRSPVRGMSASDSTANKSEHRIASLNNSNSSSSNTATNTNTNTASNYNREADQQQRRPSLTSTTLEEVLDSLLALPPNTGGSTVGSSGGQWGECGGESAGNFPSSPQCHAIRSSVPQLDDSRAASATPPSSLYRPSAPPYEHSDTDVDDDEVDLDAPPPDDVTAIHQYEQTSFVPQLTVGLVEAADSLRSSLSSTTSGPAGEAVVVEKGEEEEGGGSDLTTATATVASGSASSRSSVSGGGSGEGSGSGDSMSGQSRSSSISVSSASSSSSTGSSTGSGSSTSGSSSGKEGAGGAAAVIPPPPDFTDRLNTNGGRVTEAVPSPTPVADFREACAELGEGDRHFEHYHSTSTAPVADSHASARLDSFGAVEVEEVVVEEMKPDVVEELQYDVAAIVERSRPAHRSVTNDEVDALLAATLLIPAEVAGSSAAPLPPRGGASGSSSSDSFPPPPDSVQMEEINRRQADDEAYHSLEVGGGTGSYQQVSPCETDIDPYVFAHVTKLQPILSSDEVDEDSDRCDSNEDNDEVEVKVDRPPFVEPYDEQPPFDSGIGYSGYGIEAALDDFFSQNNPASRIHEALYEDVDLLGSDEVGSCAHSSLHPPPPASSAADTSMGSIDCNSRYDDRTSIGTTFTSFAHVSSPQERRSEVEIRLSGSSDYYHSTTAVDESGGTAPPSESTSTRRAGQRVTGKHTRADSQLDDSVIVKCSHDQCKHSAELRDARRSFRTCHNCYTYYCSRECRKDHWMRHRRVCMYGRIRSMCKQALQCARDTPATQLYLSRLARTGFLTQGRGFVKLLFRNTDLALSFLRHGWNQLEDGPVYVAWKDLIPQEMGEEVYRAVVDLCQRYEPDAKFVLLAAVYITREVPLQTVPHWEREIVAKCARVPLHPRAIHNQEVPLLPEPSAGGAATTTTTTLIITGPPPSVAGRVGEVTVDAEGDRRHAREACFVNIQEQLLERGVNLRAQFGEAYAKLLAYVERDDPFPPLTIYPKDGRTGQTFMCVIMPDNGSGGGAPVVPDWLRGKYV